ASPRSRRLRSPLCRSARRVPSAARISAPRLASPPQPSACCPQGTPYSTDTAIPLSRRQTVTSSAAVRIDQAPLSSWDQEFSGRWEHGAHFAGRLALIQFLHQHWVVDASPFLSLHDALDPIHDCERSPPKRSPKEQSVQQSILQAHGFVEGLELQDG